LKKSELKFASALSVVYFIVAMLYVYFLEFTFELHRVLIMLFLVTINVLTIFILYYFKKFLKYYYKFKDTSRLIYIIMILETIHNIYLIIFFEKLNRTDNQYVITASIGATIIAGLFLVYMMLTTKVLKVSKKSTRLMIPFAVSFYLIPIISLISFGYSIILDQKVMITAYEYNNTSLLFNVLKSFPFLLLTVVYYRGWYLKNQKKMAISSGKK